MESIEPTNNDRNFLFYLNNFIEEELFLIERDNTYSLNKDRFTIYKQAFNKVINYVQIYKSLLTNIKKEYEYCIDELEKQSSETSKKIDEITKYETHSLTIVNLEKRKIELLNKFSHIKKHNEQLTENLNKIIDKNEKFRAKSSKVNKFDFLIDDKKEEPEKDVRMKVCIPGLSFEKSIDLVHLNNLLKEIEARIKELTLAQTKKYSNKQQKHDLEVLLFEKISVRDNHKIESNNIKNKLQLYKLALNTAREYYNGNTQYSSIQDALSKVLVNNYLNKQTNKFEDESDNTEDTGLEYEAEIILDYIERFNDLFENQKFIEAAYFAVASPKNILRNLETLYRFKNVSDKGDYTENTDPLMVFCEALIDSINDELSRPNEEISIECIKIALKYNKLELLTRWIAQRKLTFSFEAGKYIEDYAKYKPKDAKSSFELALFIYSDIKASLKAAICMAKLGRYSAMMDFVSNDKILLTNADIWLKILKECPTIELANLIVENLNKIGIQIQVDKIVSILLDSEQAENGLKFLKIQILKHANDESKKEEFKKLKSSYETLMKFSFLAQDEEQFTKEIALESRDQLQNLYSTAKLSDSQVVNQTNNANTQERPPTKSAGRKHRKEKRDKPMSFIGTIEELNHPPLEESEDYVNKTDKKLDGTYSSKIKPNQAPLLEEEEEDEGKDKDED